MSISRLAVLPLCNKSGLLGTIIEGHLPDQADVGDRKWVFDQLF